MENNENEQPLEVMPPSAIMAMEKAQIDQQIATAHQYPRSLEIFKKRALSMACLDPETADSCIYVRPVGKEKNERTGKWEQKFAEGPSIRLAEIVAVSFGNLRAASRVVEQTERYVKCQGMAHDLESNTAMSADCIEATVTREGQPYSERQRALMAKVCGAKALRDAILKVVPRALCKPILDAAKKVAAGADQPLEARRKKAQAWVGTLKIDENRVFNALGVQGWNDVTNEHLIILTGLKTAMSDGDETIDSAFPPIQGAGQKGHTPQQEGPTPPTAPGAKPPENLKSEKTAQKSPQDAPTPPTGKIPQPEAKSSPESQGQAPATNISPNPVTPEGGLKAPEPPKAPETPAATPTDDDKAEAAMGLAPATPGEPATNAVPGPFLTPTQYDDDAAKSIQLLAAKSNVSGEQLEKWLRGKKLLKENQKSLMEMSLAKRDALARTWAKQLPDIRAQK